jgi:hypothetical protein
MPPYPIDDPASASFRCLNALRYLVRSYVTNPTTMRAITDIPANTANPMGRTERCLPGSMNVAAEDDDAAAADGVDPTPVPDCAAAPPPALSGAAEGVAIIVGSALDWMVVKPLILAGGPPSCVVGLGVSTEELDMTDAVAEVLVLVDGTVVASEVLALVDGIVVVSEVLALVDGTVVVSEELALEDGTVEISDVLALDVDVPGVLTGVTVGVEVSEEVDPVVEESVDDVVLVEDVDPGTSVDEEDTVDDGAVLDKFEPEFGGLPPGSAPPDGLSVNATVHVWTSCTAGLPLTSVIGVRVMVQVWVIGPMAV